MAKFPGKHPTTPDPESRSGMFPKAKAPKAPNKDSKLGTATGATFGGSKGRGGKMGKC